jgi:hypothetical protein
MMPDSALPHSLLSCFWLRPVAQRAPISDSQSHRPTWRPGTSRSCRTAPGCRQAAARRHRASSCSPKTAPCHGDNGRGGIVEGVVADNPQPLSGPGSVKSIGNFWPAPTTVFDFIRRAMPYTQPLSMTNDQVYALTAYLLSINKVIGDTEVMDATSLPKVKMPNRDNFFPEFPELIPPRP